MKRRLRPILVAAAASTLLAAWSAQIASAQPPAGAAGAGPQAVTRADPTLATAMPLPSDAGANPNVTVAAVSCSSATYCVTGGSYTDSSGNGDGFFAYFYSGAWSAQKAMLPGNAAANPQVSMTSITCFSSASCEADGTYRDTAGNTDGVFWAHTTFIGFTASAAPLPGNAAANPRVSMGGMSYFTDGSAVYAVGTYTASDSSQRAGIWQYGFGSGMWTVIEGQDPPGSSSILSLPVVSCPSASQCEAMGTLVNTSGNQLPFVESLAGGSWTPSLLPLPADAAASQLAVAQSLSCFSSTVCVGMGNYQNTAGNTMGFIGSLVSGSWNSISAPLPSNASSDPFVSMPSVTCPGATSCIAVGSYRTTSLLQSLFWYLGSDGMWHYYQPPPPVIAARYKVAAPGSASLSAIACATTTICEAVGGYTDSGGNAQGLIDDTVGGVATATQAPLPAGAATDPVASSTAVSCPATRACASVGTYLDASGNRLGVIDMQTTLGGAYVPITPTRVWDTRAGSAVQCSNAGGCALGPGGSANVQITGVAGIPANATGVVLNLTGILPSQGTYLSVAPAGGTGLGSSSNLNIEANDIQANLVMVALPASGQVAVFNSTGTINVALDAQGYFIAVTPPTPPGTAGTFHPLAPVRVCDTRSACGGSATALGPGQSRAVTVTSASGGIPNDGTATAAAFNLTAVQGSAGTYLTAFPPRSDGTCATPSTSNLNVEGGDILPNRVVVPIGTTGAAKGIVCIFNSVGSINFIIDVNGWFGSGGEATLGALFFPVTPERICDTRSGNTTACTGHSVGAGSTLVVNGVGTASGDPAAPVAIVVNATAIQGSASTFLSLYPDGAPPSPLTSDLNPSAGQIVANLAIVGLNAGRLDVYNNQGVIDVALDAEGWFA